MLINGVTDYSMARRAILADLKEGRCARGDVCDAQTELLRAARYQGVVTDVECPVCPTGQLLQVTFAFGQRLARRNGRVVRRDEIPSYIATEGVRCYTVEVCLDCSWNYLLRSHIGLERSVKPDVSDG